MRRRVEDKVHNSTSGGHLNLLVPGRPGESVRDRLGLLRGLCGQLVPSSLKPLPRAIQAQGRLRRRIGFRRRRRFLLEHLELKLRGRVHEIRAERLELMIGYVLCLKEQKSARTKACGFNTSANHAIGVTETKTQP